AGDRRDLVRFHGEDDDVLRTRVGHLVERGDGARHHLEPVLADDAHAALADRFEVRAARDERYVLAGCREPSAHVPADRSRADDRGLHRSVRSRRGLSTTPARIAATRFMMPHTMNTRCQSPWRAATTLATKTSNDAAPLAVYRRPALADANVRP